MSSELIKPSDIESFKTQAISAIKACKNLEELKEVKIAHVGDKSPIAKANQALGQVPIESRASLGKTIGTARANINQAFADHEKLLISQRDSVALLQEKVDVSLAPRRRP
ncbi:MAG: hypothetical protein ACKN80_05125, partial [Actinomycetales bacterium]